MSPFAYAYDTRVNIILLKACVVRVNHTWCMKQRFPFIPPKKEDIVLYCQGI